jgi:hypothetical protein
MIGEVENKSMGSDITEQIVRRPTPSDIDFLVENIREDDKIEVAAAGGQGIRECIVEIPDLDKNAWVWEYEGKVMCIFGVNPVVGTDHFGMIWMLSTKFFDDYFMIFAMACKPVVDEMVRPFKYVFNYVYVENKKSIKWLRWLGFNLYEAEAVGVNGARFHRFDMRTKHV